jgi:hypothetical protein
MAIHNVVALFKAIDEKDELRSNLYACTSKGELIHCLEIHHMSFSFDEFEEAIKMMHTKCQTQEAANELFSKANWFKFLFYSLKNK